jgi:type IX secretion system PorP/SprF family membrane protein
VVASVKDIQSIVEQKRYYYFTAGFTHEVSPTVKLLPSTLIRFQDQAPLSFDANLVAVFYDAVGFGVSYRLGDSIVGLFELQINDNFHVGYAYDFTTSALQQFSSGTHEIMLNYRVKIRKIHSGLECPTYW